MSNPAEAFVLPPRNSSDNKERSIATAIASVKSSSSNASRSSSSTITSGSSSFPVFFRFSNII